MSLSQERPTNPAARRLEIKGGAVVYYDRERQENVTVDVPFEFFVLDQLATVKGWSDADESGFWSNEVRSVSQDALTVRTSKGAKETGLWADIKGSPNLAGARYHASIYIAHKSTDGLEIANLSLKGAALKAWIEFSNKYRIVGSKVVFKGWSDGKKGAVSFKVPVFEISIPDDAEKAEAVELDRKLQDYLKEYLGSPTVAQRDTPEIDDSDPIDLSEIPF